MNKTWKRKYNDMHESHQEEVISIENGQYCYCSLCNIQLANEASMKQHVLGQKHKKMHYAVESKRKIEQKCGLFIRGYFAKCDEDIIKSYFSQFGEIVWVRFQHSFLLLDYAQPESAENVLKRTHYVNGQTLIIKYRQLRRPEINAEKEEIKYFLHKLKDVSNFDEQIEILEQNLRPPPHQQFPKYNKVCEDLYKALCSVFPYCHIHPFGSTITGLGFHNSDVDVFISGIRKGNKDVSFLYRIKHLLLDCQQFVNVIVIPQAKIPILKCIHTETNLSCDVNIKNMLGVCNSRLINYYLNFDPKLRKVMMVLKYWAKIHSITGQNNLFSCYSLNLMFIFFLQHFPFTIPSVLTMQQNLQFFNNQDGWNGGFQPVSYTSCELHNATPLKLLEMFFSFYIDYEYGINIICPYLGYSLKKQLFKNLEMLPSYFHMYKQYVEKKCQPLKIDAIICVQDPFEHSRNTTSMVSASTLDMFVSFCRIGKKICERQGDALFQLLTEVPSNILSQTIVNAQYSRFAIPMRPGLRYIEEKYKKTNEKHKAWFEGVVNFTRIVLKDFLKFEVAEVDSAASKPKCEKTHHQIEISEAKLQTCFKCTGKLNLWQNRKSLAKSNNNLESGKSTIIEKEIAITEELYTMYKDIFPETDLIKFEISLEHVADPPKVLINVKKLEAYKNLFKSFITFLSVKLPSWFKSFEQEQDE